MDENEISAYLDIMLETPADSGWPVLKNEKVVGVIPPGVNRRNFKESCQ